MTATELSLRTLDFGREAAEAILGVDALYRRESGDETGLAVLNMAQPAELDHASFGSYEHATARWQELASGAAELEEPDRVAYYGQLATSTLAFIEWRARGLAFDRQLGEFLHRPARPVSDATLDQLRGEIFSLLGQMGYDGDLSARARAWEEQCTVPPDEVEEVTADLMRGRVGPHERACRGDSGEPLGRHEGLRRHRRPIQRTLQLPGSHGGAERRADADAAIVTAPGGPRGLSRSLRPVQAPRDLVFATVSAPADNLLSVVNTASSSVFEGIADTGMAMIGWDETEDDRLQGLMNRYRSAIGTGAAWRLHALDQRQEESTDWLRDQALTGGEGWVRNRMAFIAAPSRAVLIWSYWCGEPTVS